KTVCSKKAFSGMERTLHEVFRIREVRDHRTGGTVVALNPPDTGSNRDPEIDVLRLYSRYQEGGIENFRPGPLVFTVYAHLVTALPVRLIIPHMAMVLQERQGIAPLHSRFMIGSTAVRPACHRVAHDILHKMISPEGGASLRRRAVPEARTAGLACVCPAHLSRAPSRASPDPVESI